jgi:coenzyme F420-reducing hydrogenase gamma subunit
MFERKKKVRFGWFTFTCCEGCAITFIELLNDNFDRWKDKLDFKFMKTLKSINSMEDLDIAVVEGAISTEEDLKLIKKIRENSKYIIAVGSCAINGMPAGLRNNFSQSQLKEIKPILKKFKALEKVEPVTKFIEVDSTVQGCPMNSETFVKELDKFILLCEKE